MPAGIICVQVQVVPPLFVSFDTFIKSTRASQIGASAKGSTRTLYVTRAVDIEKAILLIARHFDECSAHFCGSISIQPFSLQFHKATRILACCLPSSH
jgi:hypothetical protein